MVCGSRSVSGLRLLFLEMLVIFQAVPCAAPGESVADELAVAEVVGGYLAGEIGRTVGVGTAALGANRHPVAPFSDAGVVERVDVDGHSEAVFGEGGAPRDAAEVEAGGVVGLHRTQVVGVVVVHQHHPLDGIAGPVEGAEDVEELFGDGPVADELAQAYPALQVVVQHLQVAQFGEGDRAVGLVGLARYPAPDLGRFY